jgi:AraC-like DNA-binding protein
MQKPIVSAVSTSEPARVRDELARLYPGARLTPARSSATELRLEFRSVSAGSLRLDRVNLSSAGRAHAEPPPDTLLCLVPTGGTLTVDGPGMSERCGPGQPVLCPVGTGIDVGWSAGFSELVVPMSFAAISQHAAAVTGIREEEFRFHGMRPVEPAMRRLWVATVGYLFRQLHAPESPMAHPLVQAEALGLLNTTLLAAFPNTTTAGPAGSAPTAVRRGMAFIEAHAGEPLTVADIADASGIGVRGLQAGFARHAGTTPLGFARRIRLDRAHRELEAADPTRTTVREVAARWGFAKPERFAAAYRERFGELPSRTLRG